METLEYFINEKLVSKEQFYKHLDLKCRQLGVDFNFHKNKVEKNKTTWLGKTKFHIKHLIEFDGEWRNYRHKVII